MTSEHRIGTHRYVIDEDLVHNMPDPHVSMDLQSMNAYTELLEPVFQKYGRLFMLTDGKSLFNVEARARRHLAEWPRSSQIAGSAIYGAGTVTRALVKLMAAAMDALGRGYMQNYAFFTSEAEARAWIHEERRKYLAAHPDAPR